VTVISPLVLAEIEHIMTRNIDRNAAHDAIDWLLAQERTKRVLVPALVLHRARIVQGTYAALRLDLAGLSECRAGCGVRDRLHSHAG
jgi:hypothetical protein